MLVRPSPYECEVEFEIGQACHRMSEKYTFFASDVTLKVCSGTDISSAVMLMPCKCWLSLPTPDRPHSETKSRWARRITHLMLGAQCLDLLLLRLGQLYVGLHARAHRRRGVKLCKGSSIHQLLARTASCCWFSINIAARRSCIGGVIAPEHP